MTFNEAVEKAYKRKEQGKAPGYNELAEQVGCDSEKIRSKVRRLRGTHGTSDQIEEVSFDSEEGKLEVTNGTITDIDQLYTKYGLDQDEWYLSRCWIKDKGQTTDITGDFKRKGFARPDNTFTEKWLDELAGKVSPTPPTQFIPGSDKPLVVVIADTHIGALTEDMKLMPDYNAEICREYLHQVAAEVNAYDRPVVVFHLGDIIESFTGKNKPDVWKRIEMHGAEVALKAYDILDEFFDKLNHFQQCFFLGGNHDRITNSAEDSTEGEVAELVHGIFQRVGKYITHFDKLILTPEVDNIKYILTHGDKRITNQETTKTIWEYGSQDKFNLVLSAHFHHRKFHEEGINYRNLTVPPIVTGNDFEERNGYTSSAGFLIVEEKNGKPKISDIPL